MHVGYSHFLYLCTTHSLLTVSRALAIFLHLTSCKKCWFISLRAKVALLVNTDHRSPLGLQLSYSLLLLALLLTSSATPCCVKGLMLSLQHAYLSPMFMDLVSLQIGTFARCLNHVSIQISCRNSEPVSRSVPSKG